MQTADVNRTLVSRSTVYVERMEAIQAVKDCIAPNYDSGLTHTRDIIATRYAAMLYLLTYCDTQRAVVCLEYKHCYTNIRKGPNKSNRLPNKSFYEYLVLNVVKTETVSTLLLQT